MKRKIIFALLVVLLGNVRGETKTLPYQVLCINSYHVGFSWSDEVTTGVVGYFANRDSFSVHIEYMDAKRYPNEEAMSVFYPYLKHKYQNAHFDIILTLDNSALDFVIQNHNDPLFKDVPIVFGGISNPNDYPLEKLDLYGVYEPDMFVESFDIIRNIYPDFDTVYYMADRTNTGVIYRQNACKEVALYPKYRIVELDSIYLSTLAEKISQIKGKAIIYYSGICVDGSGKFIDDWEVARVVFANAKIPVFSNYINNVPGALGGNFTTGNDHGKMCAQIVVQRLLKKTIDKRVNMPPLSGIYDYSQLQIYNIDPELLPQWSQMVNKPESIWVKYHLLIFWNAILIVFLIVVILFLVRYNTMQRNARTMMERSMAKAMEADQLKGAFLANVSHELRTPLNAICGFSEMLSFEPLEDHLADYVNIIQTNSDLLAQLVNDLLDISMIDSNTLVIRHHPVNLEHVFDKLQIQAESMLKIKGKEHIVITRRTNPVYQSIVGDEFRIIQIMMNLITNAVKYTESGEIVIGYDHPSLLPQWAEEKTRPSLMSYVKDTGVGIDAEKQQLVFERFRTVETKFVSQHGGVGLGLNISKSLVELMGGEMFVYSEPGNGSVFGFYLPVI